MYRGIFYEIDSIESSKNTFNQIRITNISTTYRYDYYSQSVVFISWKVIYEHI